MTNCIHDLKKCPCCNGKAHLNEKVSRAFNKPIYWIQCSKCWLSTPRLSDKEEILKIWSKRV